MADPKRLVILKQLTAYLESEVSIANGYQHDLAGRVFRGRLYFDSRMEVPMVSLLENPDPDRFPPEAGHNGRQAPEQMVGLAMLVQGFAAEDKVNPTDPAYLLEADVTKALAKIAQRTDPRGVPTDPDIYLLGGKLDRLVFEPSVVRPPTEQVSDTAFFWKRVTLRYADDPNDPYRL